MYLTCISGQKILDIEKTNQLSLNDELYLICVSDQKILDAKNVKQFFLPCKKNWKVDDIEIILLIVTITHNENVVKKPILTT